MRVDYTAVAYENVILIVFHGSELIRGKFVENPPSPHRVFPNGYTKSLSSCSADALVYSSLEFLELVTQQEDTLLNVHLGIQAELFFHRSA